MKIRPAKQSDLQDIAAIHIESWKDAYSDVLPAEFMAGKINQYFRGHWSEIEIKNEGAFGNKTAGDSE